MPAILSYHDTRPGAPAAPLAPVPDAHAADPLALLDAWLRFPSLTRLEAPLADYVEQHVRRAGLGLWRHGDNIVAWSGEGPDALLMASHLDVVPPPAAPSRDPWTPHYADGRVWARGAVDAKASGAAMLAALIRLHRSATIPEGARVMVALTVGEEGTAADNGMARVRPLLPPLSGAVVGEPTSLAPCIAQKGLLVLACTARGRSAHAARAHLGDSAIARAARDVARIDALVFERDHPVLGYPTAVVTTIEGGSARNVVPDSCRFYVDVRSTPAYTHAELARQIGDALESDVDVHSDRIIPVGTDADARVVAAARQAVPARPPFGSPTTSDWIFLDDVPAVKLGPGDSERSHTPDEHIALDAVSEAADVYATLALHHFAQAPGVRDLDPVVWPPSEALHG